MLFLTPNDARLKHSQNTDIRRLRALNWTYSNKDCTKTLYMEFCRGAIFIEGVFNARSYEDFTLQLFQHYGVVLGRQLIEMYLQNIFNMPNNPILVNLPENYIFLKANRKQSIKKINGKIYSESWITDIVVGSPITGLSVAITGEIGAVFELVPKGGFVFRYVWSSNSLLMDMFLSQHFPLECVNNQLAQTEEQLLNSDILRHSPKTEQAVIQLMATVWKTSHQYPFKTNAFIQMIDDIRSVAAPLCASRGPHTQDIISCYLNKKPSCFLLVCVLALASTAVAVISVAAIFLVLSYLSPLVGVAAISAGVIAAASSYGLYKNACAPSATKVVNQYLSSAS